MQITVGKIVILAFVLIALAAVASVMGSPEFEHARIAWPTGG